MKPQLKIYKHLHGQNKHVCKRPGCRTMTLGSYCLDHIESAIAKEWNDLDETGEADEPPRQKLEIER